MSFLRNLLLAGTVTLSSLLSSSKETEACSSAISMGRGGTNVAVADDASATYWNPAGLIQLERPELEYTHGENINYEHFFCYAQPIDENSAFGFNLSRRNFGSIDTAITDWLKLSYSRKINDKLSLGTNLTLGKKYDNIDGSVISPEQTGYPFYIENIFLSIDLGALYNLSKNVKVGLLLQDMSNIRPGISFKLKNNLLLAFEGYVVGNFYDLRHFRSGLEIKINKNISIRTGCAIEDSKLYYTTLGASFNFKNFETSIAYKYWGDNPFDDNYPSLFLTGKIRF